MKPKVTTEDVLFQKCLDVWSCATAVSLAGKKETEERKIPIETSQTSPAA